MAWGEVPIGQQQLKHFVACIFFYFVNHKVRFQICQSQTEKILLNFVLIKISADQPFEQFELNFVGGIAELEV